jgi:4-hydroxy-3-polyprenylbenzoate decarboxylase
MLAVTEMGGVIAPPVPAMYAEPKTLGDVIDQNLARVLDLYGIHLEGARRWGEDGKKRPAQGRTRP